MPEGGLEDAVLSVAAGQRAAGLLCQLLPRRLQTFIAAGYMRIVTPHLVHSDVPLLVLQQRLHLAEVQ